MGIPQILFKTGKCLLNRAGIMTERQMVAATTRAGRYARDILASGGKLTDELADSIFKRVLPKGVKPPAFVTTSSEATADFVTKAGIFTREKTIQTWNHAGGINYLDPFTAESMITLNPSLYSPNVVAHEFRHHLDQTVPVSKKVSNLFDKLLSKLKSYREEKRNFINYAQDKYMQLEKMILGKMGILDPSSANALKFEPTKVGFLKKLGVTDEELSSYLSKTVHNMFCNEKPKESIKFLKKLIFLMKTEQNAQRAGSKITRTMAHIKPYESCPSDMSEIFHGEMIPALQKELMKQRKNYYKSLLGFKIQKGQIENAKLNVETDLSKLVNALTDDKKTGGVIVYDALTKSVK